MNAVNRRNKFSQSGQTLVIALIVLFVLLLLGFVFLGILNRNINQADTSRQRSLSADLADAGIRYAHEQLVNNSAGADWHPDLSAPINTFASDPVNHPNPVPGSPRVALTNDPDIYYLRPAPLNPPATSGGISSGPSLLFLRTTDAYADKGGPDGLGPFSRIQFRAGRALVRVRYAPSDVDITQTGSAGPLLTPGKVHSYLIIESIGRPGFVNSTDPTTLTTSTRGSVGPPSDVAYQYFANAADLRSSVADMSNRDNQFVTSRKLIAFAYIGLTDHAIFITNKDHSTLPADLGTPYELGTLAFNDNDGQDYDVHVPMQIGSTVATKTSPFSGLGSVYVNASVNLQGSAEFSFNKALGEGLFTAGTITGANSIKNPTAFPAQATLHVFDGSTHVTDQVLSTAGSDNLESNSSAFSTVQGVWRDSVQAVDPNGNPRSIGFKTPPTLRNIDPNTGANRYLVSTRDSGVIRIGGNSGQYGQGKNVYVNNASDLQTQMDQNGRMVAGSSDALFYDWLNPNNGQPNSAWQGQYYVPAASYVLLTQDGFTITRNSNAPAGEKTWHDQDGNDSSLTTLRYRIEPNVAQPHIINTLTPNVNINDPSPDYSRGPLFGGLLYFEGNVRVRGVIPTDRQLTLVSMGNIYVEGSITKGVQNPSGGLINHASRSMLGLLAEDYVVVNTSQFFGPGTNQVVEKNSTQNPTGYNPVVIQAANGFQNLWSEFLLDPDTGGTNPPNMWTSYAHEYIPAGTTTPSNPYMLTTHTMDDGPAPNAELALVINSGATAFPDYLFPNGAGTSSIYELGAQNWQRYARFETRGFPLVTTATTGQSFLAASQNGQWQLNLQNTTGFTVHTANQNLNPTNDILLARSAIVPQDVRIEAVMFAEQGSFFVIPGNWFNPNPNDRRENYASLGATDAERQLNRLQDYGNYPEAPFYGEPLDVRISIIGSINENMPAPISQQSEWLKKWGWIPRMHGASGELIPIIHEPSGYDVSNTAKPIDQYLYVPNLTIRYDPMLAGGRVNGFAISANPAVRPNPQDPTGNATLPPLPGLPVSPTLFYFGEVNP